MKFPSVKSLASAGLIALLVNTAYVAAFASPTIFYMGNVLAHVVLGIVVAGVDGRGRRRTAFAVFSLVCEDERGRHHSVELFHGLGHLRRVPQGHLRSVAELGASFRIVQQSVLPEVDRIHAVGRRAAAEQM